MTAERTPHPLGFAGAEILSGLSMVAPHIPWLGAKILGEEQMQAVRWRHSRTQQAEDVGRDYPWLEFDGNSASGRTPANYETVAMLAIRKHVSDVTCEQKRGEQAVAYAAGRQVMIGTAREGQLFDNHPLYPDRYAISMGIGRAPLLASMGCYADGIFYPLTDRNYQPPIVQRNNSQVTVI